MVLGYELRKEQQCPWTLEKNGQRPRSLYKKKEGGAGQTEETRALCLNHQSEKEADFVK